MAERAPGSGRIGSVRQRTRATLVLRLAGRVSATFIALLVFALVAVQFARVIDENVALARDLNSTQSDIVSLQTRREMQIRELRRLQDPDGAVPEIHDRLKLVKPNEAIIFVSPAPSAAPSSAP
jgi:cell division protein FtsB